MKKRLISLLLTVVMLMSLCTVLSTGASAAANVTTVTLAKGQTVLSLCQSLGVDFYTYKNLIMTLNGFTSEAQFSKLAVGQQIVLPASAAAAATLAGSTTAVTASTVNATTTAGTTPATISTATNTTGTLTTGQATSIPSGDRVAYYLVYYTIQSGETIQGIYANWGLSYKTYDNQIKKLNNISSYNSIAAGKTLILPTTNPGVANSSYYTVMAHTMLSGESAYDIICSQYGMNFSANQKLILALNNTTDLSNIWAGSALYIPVSGIVSTSTTVTSGTTSTTTTSATVSTGGVYNLVSQTATNGSFDMQVDGKSVTTAQAGKTVQVIPSADIGYAVDTIKVVKVGDASTVVGVSNGYFTMPSYSVVVSVTFKTAAAYKITVDSASNGSVAALVNGAKVTQGYVGNTVTVKTIPATGFMLDHIRVTYNNYKDSVAVYNNTFVMPDCDVTITATFVKDPDYDPTLGHSIYTNVSNGTITTYVGNTETEYANTGDRVTIDVTPDTNYTLESLVVYYDDFKKTAEVDKSSFTMPDGPVTIVATIKATSAAKFAITKVDTANGTFGVYNDGTEVTEAKVGTTLTVKGTPKSGAYWYLVKVTKTGDSSISVPVTYNEADGTSTFTMPDFPISVQTRFYLYHRVILDSSNGSRGYFAVVAGSNKIDKCACGVELSVNIWGVKSGYAATSVILTYADGSSYTLDGATFIMPDCDVKVKVVFNEQQTIVAHSATVDGKYGQYGNTYTVGGKTMNGNKAATAEVKAGAGWNVTVNTSPAFGYEVDTITIKYTDKSGTEKTAAVTENPVTEKYQFEMPELKAGTKLDLYVSFKPITTYAITLDYRTGYSDVVDEDSTVVGNLDHKKGTFNVTTYTHSAYVDHAKKDQKIQIHAYPASGYAVDTDNIQVINVTTGANVEINKNDYTFIMPDSDVQVIVPFVETAHSIELLRANDGTDGLPKGVLSVIIDGVQYKDEDLLKNSNVRLKFPIGTLVTVVNESRSGYVLNSEQPIVINRKVGGALVKYNTIDGDHFTFEMPNDDVIISAQYNDEMVAINAVASDHGTYSVPLQVAWNGSFSVTDIVPEQGYELDKILVTYVGHDGTKHEKEELNGTKVDLSNEKGMLLSDINVEVTFKAAVNPMTIRYIFDDTPDQNSNYKVDLLVDGKNVEGIDRGYSFDKDDSGSYSGYTDHLYKYDGDNSENGLSRYGIQTGKTVIIKRNESKLDQNFRIVNIWVMNGSGDTAVAIKPDFSNNQYYFTMPYVGSGKSEDLTLYIEYGKYTADAFNLSAYKAGGDGESAGWQFYVQNDDGVYVPTNSATVTAENIKLEITVPDYCEITNPAAVLRYKDSDGVERTQDLVLEPDGDGKYSVPFVNPVKSMPQGSIVSVEYNVDKKSYEMDENVYNIDADGKLGEDSVGTAAYTVDGAEATSAKWDKTVTVTVTSADGKVVDNVKIFRMTDEAGEDLTEPEEISASRVNNGTYQFTMPKGEIAVAASFKKVSTTVKFDNTIGNSNVHAVINVEGIEYNDLAAVEEGQTVSFKLSVPANYTVESGSVKLSDENIDLIGPDASGAYSFTMPEESVVITAEITAKTYTMRVYPLTSKAGVNVPYSVKLSDTVVDNNSGEYTAEVRYGDKFEIAAVKTDGEITYKIDSCTITYTDINNTPVSLNADITDGVASFTFNGAIPRGNEGDLIEVKPTIVENKKATYKLILSPTADEYYSLSTNITDIENITIGKSVTIYMDVKYYMDFNPDSVSFSYTVDGQQYSLKDKVTVGKVSGTDLSYRYTFTFSMPASDVNVNIEASGFTEKTQVKTTGTNVYVIDANGNYTAKTQFNLNDQAYVKLDSQKIADGYICKVRLTYKTENSESITYEQDVVTDSGAGYGSFNLSRDDRNSSHIPVGATFTVEVSYTQST
jgi:hypothetical protein